MYIEFLVYVLIKQKSSMNIFIDANNLYDWAIIQAWPKVDTNMF